MNMLLVCTIPNEDSKFLKEKSRLSGKSVAQYMRDLLKEQRKLSIKKNAIDEIIDFAKKAPHVIPEENWTREELYER